MVDVAELSYAVATDEVVKGTQDLDQMAKSTINTDNRSKKLTETTKKTGKSIDDLSRSARKANTASRSTGLAMRNLGFQLNQGAQQGAVTGDYFRALLIQLPDMLLFAGGIGLAAGIAAGALAPLVISMANAGDTSRKLSKDLEALENALKSYKGFADAATLSTGELDEKFGTASTGLRTAIDLLEQISRNEAQAAIDEVSNSLSDLLGVAGATDKRTNIAEFFDVNIFLAFTKAQREARKEARELTGEFVAAQNALEASEGNLEMQAQALQRLISTTETLVDLDKKRTQEEEALLKPMAEALKLIEEQLAKVEQVDQANNSSLKAMQNAQRFYAETRLEANKLASEIGQAATNALALAGIDITGEISSAAKEAAKLAAQLDISLIAAINLQNLRDSKAVTRGPGRGQDPRLPVSTLGPDGIQAIIDRENKKNRSGAGGSDDFKGNLETLIQSLETEQETIERFKDEGEVLLNDRRARELLGEEEHKQALLRLEESYQNQKIELARNAANAEFQARAAALNALSGLLGVFSGKSRAAAIAVIAINKGLSIAQAIQNTAVAQTRALAELGPILGPPAAAKIAAFGKLQVGLIAATGLIQAAAPSGGVGTLSSGRSSASAAPRDTSPTQRVLLDFNGAESWLADMFGYFTKQIQENSDSGVIYEVAR